MVGVLLKLAMDRHKTHQLWSFSMLESIFKFSKQSLFIQNWLIFDTSELRALVGALLEKKEVGGLFELLFLFTYNNPGAKDQIDRLIDLELIL